MTGALPNLQVLEKPSRGLSRVGTQHPHRQGPVNGGAWSRLARQLLKLSQRAAQDLHLQVHSGPLLRNAATPSSEKPRGWDSQTQPLPPTGAARNLPSPPGQRLLACWSPALWEEAAARVSRTGREGRAHRDRPKGRTLPSPQLLSAQHPARTMQGSSRATRKSLDLGLNSSFTGI